MKHLKLGTYSFIIDVEELELTRGEQKTFTRDELPRDLKSLYDIVASEKVCEKSIFLNVITLEGYSTSGYLTQNMNGGFDYTSDDGALITITHPETNKIAIRYDYY